MLGLINVTQAVAWARTLPAALDEVFAMQGLGAYTSDAFADGVGVVISLASVLSLVLAINFAVRRLRQHRVAFWIPIAASAVQLLVMIVFAVIAVAADPAFAAYLQRSS